MADGYILNDRDRELLKELRRELERKRQNPAAPPSDELVEAGASEVYVAKTPVDGIPAMTATNPPEPGSAVCDVYSLLEEDTYVLRPIEGLDKIILNIAADDIPGDTWVQVNKTKSGYWLAIKGATDSSQIGNCDSCGWLQDRWALLGIAEGMPPVAIQQYRVFKAMVTKHVGRCDCIDETQAPPEPPDNPDPFLLFYETAVDAWIGRRNFKTCCGCAKLTFDVTPTGADPATLKILVDESCVAADPASDREPYEYFLKFQCCKNGKVTFSGVGQKDPNTNTSETCDGDPPYPCNNDFEITIECIPPPDSTCDCRACWPKRTPHGFRVEAGMSFSNQDYNGSWLLEPPYPPNADGCLFQGRCGIMPSITFNDGSGKWILTIGIYSYEFTPDLFSPCLVTGTFSLVGGPIVGAPNTLDVIPIIPEALLDEQADCCVAANLPTDLYVTSAARGVTLHLIRSGNIWDTSDDDNCATDDPLGFSFYMELDPATCLFTPNGSSSCCVIDPQPPTKPTSLSPFLLTFTGTLEGPSGQCEASETLTITDTAP